jgi:hypothetical protein
MTWREKSAVAAPILAQCSYIDIGSLEDFCAIDMIAGSLFWKTIGSFPEVLDGTDDPTTEDLHAAMLWFT